MSYQSLTSVDLTLTVFLIHSLDLMSFAAVLFSKEFVTCHHLCSFGFLRGF